MTANSMTGRRKTAPRGRRSDAQKNVKLYSHSSNIQIRANCRIGRLVRARGSLSRSYPSFARPLSARRAPTARTGLITRTEGPSAGGIEAIFDPPALDPYAWVTAKPRDERQFVDGIGLRQLYDAASPDHRGAFVARLLAELPQDDRPERLPPNIEMYLNRLEHQSPSDVCLDLPGFLRRRSPDNPELAKERLALAKELSGNCRHSERHSSCPTASTENGGWSSDDGGD
jgi:hypothetical protein